MLVKKLENLNRCMHQQLEHERIRCNLVASLHIFTKFIDSRSNYRYLETPLACKCSHLLISFVIFIVLPLNEWSLRYLLITPKAVR